MSFPILNPVPSSSASLTIPNREDGWAPGPRDISVTPSGQHMWAMTPGGTKLMWTRDQLMHMSHSPLSRSPFQLHPEVLFLGKGAPVPEDHCEDDSESVEEKEPSTSTTTTTNAHQQNGTEDDVFEMDS